MVLHGQLLISIGIPEQEISVAVSGESAVEIVSALGLTEQILDLLVKCPAATKLKLMGSLGPGDVVANLVVIGLVVPWPAGHFELGVDSPAQVDVGDAAQVVGSRE